MASSVVSDNFETSTGAIPNMGGADVTTRLCSAWVNFNGTGAVAIRAAYNVSSITDNGTGDYTANFTTAMPDVNYSSNTSNALGSPYVSPVPSDQANPIVFSTSSIRVQTGYFSGAQTLRDQAIVCVSIFR